MLGYDKEDLDIMIATLEDTLTSAKLNKKQQGGLLTTLDFLGGLWAEGYFD